MSGTLAGGVFDDRVFEKDKGSWGGQAALGGIYRLWCRQ